MSASQRKVAAKKTVSKKLDMDSSLSGVSSAVSALACIAPPTTHVKASRTLREKVLTKTVRAKDPEKHTQPSGSAEPALLTETKASGSNTAEREGQVPPTSSRDSDVTACTAEPGRGEVCGEGEPAVSEASVVTPNDQTLQKIYNWQQDDLSPMPVISDDESVVSLPASPVLGDKRRQSMLLTSGRRLGVEMDAATKEANEALLRGKEALESSGNIRRDCKQTALESLQTLYEIALALSDSRSRHKENLEKERSRHARELVRAERAHSKEMAELFKNVATELGQARGEIVETLKESRATRDWLGCETREPFEQIGQLSRALADLGKKQEYLADCLARHKEDPAGSNNKEFSDIKTALRTLSSQLDALRRDSEKAEREHLKAKEAFREILSAVGSQQNDHGMAGVVGELANIRSEIVELFNFCRENRATVSPAPPETQEGTREAIEPLRERLDIVVAELRGLKE
ncbi:unnamed protein product, partial [Arctia plantaginis]